MDIEIEAKFDSVKNNECIIIESRKFCRSKVLNDTVRFRCARKKCGSRVLVSSDKFNTYY